ncbi:LysM peptidoglycan-binding domain-containing protein [Halomonas sp. MCCC 1A17488]|uniref:LysM peptidoglycan-binding domain-containing protein n=1 Tax=unclassified Halomonas TaxID=2609666 RepID=UPI0018D21519|nr:MULTISPECIES: LysM peptidoglycan-binding domain-containing protein [unclassified Halomonas]MCE8015071.1 LysM peptidoglycan-binding domain-containing protein [Halomonas sp. MCCC 1A17488]MCG3238404.1 LysM peptidoglycan-binding domain-containing protein [Halomonas sp. MCCC 1A17488]QPP47853.1 LysM peptidoglycan-binding domain-containing protein [Halomonas sp. SS10-MC5]
MAQRPVAGKRPGARIALTLLYVLALLSLVACASPGGEVQRSSDPGIAGSWVVVQRGDTLGSIAARADVPLARLQRFNPGVNANRLAVGQRLLIPTQQERAPSGGPYRYQIRPGDTFSAVARRFGTTPARIQSANPGVAPTRLRVGQLIQVPLRGSTTTTTARSSSASSSRASTPSRPASPPTAASAPSSVPGSARNWPWPLEDYRVVRAYGTDSRGTLQPMLLATNRGARAKAVADGDVRFAGSMRQLGRVVIVHHADNLQSVYALCDKLLVDDGARVSRGTPLCEVGFSNATERFDLLFDIRLGGKPIDPRRVLR